MEKQTLAEKAAERLLEMIRENGMQPGDRLPTEPELMQTLGIGRNTVREALRLLMSRNVVVIRQGAGTFVSEKNGVPDDPLGFTMVEDRRKLTKDLLEVRVMLEPKIAELAAQNAVPEDVEALERILLAMEEKIRARELYAKEDAQFHEQIANCTHNQVMASLIPVITRGVQIFAETVDVPEFEQTLLSHREIFEAIRDGRPVNAERAMYFHLIYNQNRY